MSRVFERLPILSMFALILCAGSSAFPQEMSPASSEKLKGATVLVTVPGSQGVPCFSGFLFRKKQDTGYVITLKFRVRDSANATVVFFSGTSMQKSYLARVIDTDDRWGLACLLIEDAADLPTPLEIGGDPRVEGRQIIYVGGPEPMRFLEKDKKEPQISVEKGVVWHTQAESATEIARISINCSLRGNSSFGAPVVDSEARVIGLVNGFSSVCAVQHVLPVQYLRSFMRGKSLTPAFTPVHASATSVKLEVALELVDPLDMLKHVGIAYVSIDKVKEEAMEPKEGVWSKIDSAMTIVPLATDGELAKGAFEIKRMDCETGTTTLLFQVYHERADGTTHWTEPDALDISFLDATADAEAPGVPRDGKPSAEGSSIELEIPDELSISATLKLDSVIRDMVLPGDKSFLYVLDMSQEKVLKIAAGTLNIAGEVKVDGNITSMAVSPDGKTLYLGARSKPHATGSGIIRVVSTERMNTTSMFGMDKVPSEMVATDTGMLFVFGTGNWGVLTFVDANKGRHFGHPRYHSMTYGPYLQFHPDESRAYCGSKDAGMSDSFLCVLLKKDSMGLCTSYASRNPDKYPLGGDFLISPDGKHLIACTGSVLRLHKYEAADLKYVNKIDPCIAIAMAKDCDTIFTSSASGLIRTYSMLSFELKKSVNVKKLCWRLALDAERKLLYAVVVEPEPDPSYEYRFDEIRSKVANIVAFSLSEN